ncbi:MAG: sulfatase-like hydrolase/transferase [Phycisphaera sp.]|nr:sulfatase-like hydrolase/transferase [Phycisphaera sp.]
MADTDAPNILWICTDQQRYDTIGALGQPLVRTPHIDKLIGEGVTFDRAYCQSPVCTPSRASFLTGRYPRTTRCRQNGQSMPATERLVPRELADRGYVCGLAGKLHLASASAGKIEPRIDDGYADEHFHWSHHPQDDWGHANAYIEWLASRGHTWDELYGPAISPWVYDGIPAEHHQTTWCAEQTSAFIREMGARGGGHVRQAPWMFSVNIYAPHHPFDPPREYLDRYLARNPLHTIPLPRTRPGELDSKTTFMRADHHTARDGIATYTVDQMSDDDKRLITAAYHAMCEHIDDAVGTMLAALDESGQRDNTLVIFMSDHGELLGDHDVYLKGPHFFEPSVHVPLTMRWPGRFREGLRVDGLVELVDLAPTLLNAAEIDTPEAMQGRSLLPICTGDADPSHHRDHVFCEYYNAWQHKDAYGTMLRTADHKIVVYHGTDQGELYDLRADPDEFDNLWDDAAHAETKVRLMKACFDASVFTMDPTPVREGEF